MSFGDAFREVVEQGLNRYVGLDPHATEQFARLHGKVICLDVIGLGPLYLIPGPAGFQVQGTHEGEPDCTLRGTPLALMRMRGDRSRTDQLMEGHVRISGDTDLGHRFGNILASLDIDWEEQLSHLTGDVIAHEVGNLFRGLSQWGRKGMDTFGLNLKDYLEEETRAVPSRFEIQQFLADVDSLKDDAERLQARIRRLRQRLESTDGPEA